MKRLLDAYSKLLRWTMTGLMALMLVPVSLQIVSRFAGVAHYIWTEEAARFCFIWIIMIGAMVAVRDGTHFVVDVMPPPRSDRELAGSRLIVHVAMSLMAVVFAGYGVAFAKFGAVQQSEMSGINMLSIYISFPLTGATWMLFLVEKMAEDVRLMRSKPAEDPR